MINRLNSCKANKQAEQPGVSQSFPAVVEICLNPQNRAYLRMGARRRGKGRHLAPWEMYKARFASVTKFCSAQKEPKCH